MLSLGAQECFQDCFLAMRQTGLLRRRRAVPVEPVMARRGQCDAGKSSSSRSFFIGSQVRSAKPPDGEKSGEEKEKKCMLSGEGRGS